MHKWVPSCIFFDLGGVLFFDEYIELYFAYQIFLYVQNMINNLTTELYFKQREALYSQFKNQWIHIWLDQLFPKAIVSSIISFCWEETLSSFDKLFTPYPNAFHFLQTLSQKYPIYCVANQPCQAKKVLEKLKFNLLFQELFIDSFLGFSKPDARIFQLALDKSGFLPNQVLFIGDRLDNDIIPAKLFGMEAIKLTLPAEFVHIPTIPLQFSKMYYRSIQNLWYRWEKDDSLNYHSMNSYEEIRALLCN